MGGGLDAVAVEGVAAVEDGVFEVGVASLSDLGAGAARYDLRLCRSISSHNNKTRTNLNPAVMPMRSAMPPPTGPPPPPPVPAGNNYRGYPGGSS